MYYRCVPLRDLFFCPRFLAALQTFVSCLLFNSPTRTQQEQSETMLCCFIRRHLPERFCWWVRSSSSTSLAALWHFSASLMSLAWQKSHAETRSPVVRGPRGLLLGPVFHLALWNNLLPPSEHELSALCRKQLCWRVISVALLCCLCPLLVLWRRRGRTLQPRLTRGSPTVIKALPKPDFITVEVCAW